MVSPELLRFAEERATLCVRIANATMPGADADAVENKALELMDFDDAQLDASANALVHFAAEEKETRQPGKLPHAEACRLAEMMACAREDGARLKVIEDLFPEQRRDVETLSKNPCKTCGTFMLGEKWVGSAYCSLNCCLNEMRDLDYAEDMLQHYEVSEQVFVCRKCGCHDPMTVAVWERLEKTLGQPTSTRRWPQHTCPACGATTS